MTHEQKAREALSAGEAYADSVDAETGSVVSVNDFANGYLSGHAAAKKECEAEIAALEKITKLAVSLAEQFERAVESRRPVSGMSVPPSGDFIACAQLPSAVSRMKWWAREIRRAQTEWSEGGK